MLRRWILVLTVLACLPGSAAAAVQADSVVFRRGTLIVGEIEQLRRGDIYVDTEEMNVVRIDWSDVAAVRSVRLFEVESVNGVEYFGSLATADLQIDILQRFDGSTAGQLKGH